MENLETAYFAGGCFWCIEGIMDGQEWVVEAVSGYAWGTEINPTYEQVAWWLTSHREWVKVLFDPEIISMLEFGIPLPAITKLPSGLTLMTSSLIVSLSCFLDVVISIGLASTTSLTNGTTNSFSSIKFGW